MKHLFCISFILLAGCDAVPVRVYNDTGRTIAMDIHGRDFPTPIELEEIKPGGKFGTRHCWKHSDAILLATRANLEPIVLNPKDFCDPDKCDCEIQVSRLVKRMSPRFVLQSQRDVCAGRGPFLQPGNRAELCAAYVERSAGHEPTALFSLQAEAMLRR